MSASLESYVNRPVSVITADGRNFVGTLKVEQTENTMVSFDVFYWQGFDQTINLILDETHERVYSPGQGVEQVSGDCGDLAGSCIVMLLYCRWCWVSTLSGGTISVWSERLTRILTADWSSTI